MSQRERETTVEEALIEEAEGIQAEMQAAVVDSDETADNVDITMIMAVASATTDKAVDLVEVDSAVIKGGTAETMGTSMRMPVAAVHGSGPEVAPHHPLELVAITLALEALVARVVTAVEAVEAAEESYRVEEDRLEVPEDLEVLRAASVSASTPATNPTSRKFRLEEYRSFWKKER